ncbi:hypothetical protein E2562_024094 [Oryza meyeriana var. granulata]|uniref:Uncharacterized protein n=1 Tax=Oryza meyeriana var. granulata TaxID=110450 RepID=A0A6G1CI10_9ORYZ|nr:hypothetical protein E2562_024094 [Oryza meyeriana var. granulata]
MIARALLSSARVTGGTVAVSCGNRSYSVAAAAAVARQEPAGAAGRTTVNLQATKGATGNEGFFWMREPRTGN